MIAVNNIAVKVGDTHLIREVSCFIRPSQISVVIGKNGAGKSTLMGTMCGIKPICQGHITWDGLSFSKLSVEDLAKRRAVLSQQVKLNFPMKVGQIVEMGLYTLVQALSPKEKDSMVLRSLERVGMTGFINRDFDSLSGGEQKRVMLAKCLLQLSNIEAHETHKYLFLDEPTASLDLEQQYKLLDLIKSLVRESGIGVFAILHDLNLTAQLADEILMMKGGKIIAQGSPKEVLTPKLIKATLDVDAAVNDHPALDCPNITILPSTHISAAPLAAANL